MSCCCQKSKSFVDANATYCKRRCPFEEAALDNTQATCKTPCNTTVYCGGFGTCGGCEKCNCCNDYDDCCHDCNRCDCDTCNKEKTCCGMKCQPFCCQSLATSPSSYRVCCDPNGTCCLYPCCCRNQFWPNFAHPRWLCCADLYQSDDN